MKRFIVDANVLIAALKKDGNVRGLLLSAPPDVALYAPEFLFIELDAHLEGIARSIGLPKSVVEVVLDALEPRINIVPPDATDHVIEKARGLAEQADALGDEEYIALALAMDAPIWSFDKDFDRVPGIQRVGTAQIRTSFEG